MTFQKSTITAVVVTYGNRWGFLNQVLLRLDEADEVLQVVVVDNASHYDVAEKCRNAFSSKIKVHRNGKNLGSAGGFSYGITIATQLESEYILLLDDDVIPTPGAVSTLLQTYHKVNEAHSDRLQAVTAYRFSQYGKLLVPLKTLRYEDHAAFGLNLCNFIDRHFITPSYGVKKVEGVNNELTRFGTAYAGLLISREIVKAIGVPRSDFVLYNDDIEYSLRIIRDGGNIWLDTNSEFIDICDNVSGGIIAKPFLGFLLNPSDLKSYYIIRNNLFIERFCLKRKSLMYNINCAVFFLVLSLLGLSLGRFRRTSVLWSAFLDGVRGRLGINPKFSLE